MSRWRQELDRNNKKANPQIVADRIAAILDNPNPKLRYVVGNDAKMALTMRAILPWSAFERVIIKLSGMDK